MACGRVRCGIAASTVLIAAGAAAGCQTAALAFRINREITGSLQDVPADVAIFLVDDVGTILYGNLPVITSLKNQADAVADRSWIVSRF